MLISFANWKCTTRRERSQFRWYSLVLRAEELEPNEKLGLTRNWFCLLVLDTRDEFANRNIFFTFRKGSFTCSQNCMYHMVPWLYFPSAKRCTYSFSSHYRNHRPRSGMNLWQETQRPSALTIVPPRATSSSKIPVTVPLFIIFFAADHIMNILFYLRTAVHKKHVISNICILISLWSEFAFAFISREKRSFIKNLRPPFESISSVPGWFKLENMREVHKHHSVNCKLPELGNFSFTVPSVWKQDYCAKLLLESSLFWFSFLSGWSWTHGWNSSTMVFLQNSRSFKRARNRVVFVTQHTH